MDGSCEDCPTPLAIPWEPQPPRHRRRHPRAICVGGQFVDGAKPRNSSGLQLLPPHRHGPPQRDMFKDHPHYARTEEFIALYDDPAFDASYDTLPIQTFEPMLRKGMALPVNSVDKDALNACGAISSMGPTSRYLASPERANPPAHKRRFHRTPARAGCFRRLQTFAISSNRRSSHWQRCCLT